MANKNYFFAGGRLYYSPVGANGVVGEEREIGDVTDISIAVETEKVEAISRDTGASEVVAEVVTKRDYNLTFTTINTATANLALFVYGVSAPRTFVDGDTYRGKPLKAFDVNELWEAGDVVIEGGAVYEALVDTTGAFTESEWKRLGGATVTRTSANKITSVVGKLRFETVNLSGAPTVVTLYKVNLSPSGDLALATADNFREFVFDGKLQRDASGNTMDIDEEVE